MNLEQLKAILDNGGIIARGKETIKKSNGYYNVYHKHLCIHSSEEWAGVRSPSEWQEVKAEEQYVPHARFYAENRPYAPCMIAIDIREWDALQKELEELRAFKAKHSENKSIIDQALDAIKDRVEEIYDKEGVRPIVGRYDLGSTFDAPTEYKGMGHTRRLANLFNSTDPDWKSILHSGKILIDEIGNTVYKQRACFTYYFDGVEPNGSNNRAYENWEECLEYMNQYKGWKIKDQ
jgi:hypothetical protein